MNLANQHASTVGKTIPAQILTEARRDTLWQEPELVWNYLTGVRGAIPLANEQLDVMMRLLAARQQPVRSFLDLGCGDAVLAAAILARYPQARGLLLDFSEPMLRAARQRLGERLGQLEFKQVDYADTQWAACTTGFAPFDAIVSGFSIHHQPDPRKRELYAEAFSLLSPGGWFVNIEHVASPTPWLESIHDELFVDAMYALSGREKHGKTREQVAANYHGRADKAANLLAPVEHQCEWLREIGYQDVDCYLKIFELAVFGGRRPE